MNPIFGAEGLSFVGFDQSSPQYADLNACPNVTAGTRPEWLYPNNPVVDPFSFYRRAFTFQVSCCSASLVLVSC